MRSRARLRVALLLLAFGAVAAALPGCPSPAPPARVPELREPVKPASQAGPRGPMYVIADPDALARGGALILDATSFGAVVDGQRVIGPIPGAFGVPGAGLGGAQAGSGAGADKRRIGREITSPLISSVDRIPPWLGGGFLFRAGSALYASEAFDGPLRPLVSISAGISRIAFGPKGALVRSSDGQRWVIDLATGARLPPAPVGLLDIAALADGRAAALTEGGRLFTSQDRGEHWADVTPQLGGAPARLVTQSSRPSGAHPRADAPGPADPAALELWITDELSHAYRLEPGGMLREFDQLPAPPPSSIRPRDPAWHGTESPLLAAVRRGVRLDDGTALVAENGDIARVDLRTGELRVTAAGRVPPDLPCEGVRAGDDVIFICATRGRPSAVISRVLGDEGTLIERTFPEGGPFYASDDGTIIFGGACDGQRMRTSVCVRSLNGEWQSFNFAPASDAGIDASADAGADGQSFDPADIVRWIPRPGGRPLGILGGKSPGTFDPVTGLVTRWETQDSEQALDPVVKRALFSASAPGRDRIVDRTWTITDIGDLHGWVEQGEAVLISPVGEVTRSAYRFPRIATSGPVAFAFDRAQRAWQTTDRGDHWIEVEAPPRTASSGPHQCSSVGCDLGAWARIGWDATRPNHELPPPTVAPPPSLPKPALREITCAPAGDERVTSLQTGDTFSMESCGLGARRLPVSSVDAKDQVISYRRRFFSRGMVNPVFNRAADDERAVRMLVHGFSAEFVSPDEPRGPFDGITVLGPSRDAQSFRRTLTFLEAFDPTAAVRNASFGLRELIEPTRSTGIPLGRLFSPEGPEIDAAIPILPLELAGASGYVFTLTAEVGQIVGWVLGGTTPRLKIAGMHTNQETGPPVSAAEVAPGEIAVLTVLSDGAGEVYRLSAAGITGIFKLAAPPSPELSPANPDALAVGPQGALAILRTPSGAEPPSALDPALLFAFSGGPPQALAPWSTLTPADDPACRADTTGYRVIVNTVSPWIRVKNSPPPGASNVSVMSARVRWSATRVCLEALELPSLAKPTQLGEELETTVVARFTAKEGAARIGMGPGVELRQALSCSLLPL